MEVWREFCDGGVLPIGQTPLTWICVAVLPLET